MPGIALLLAAATVLAQNGPYRLKGQGFTCATKDEMALMVKLTQQGDRVAAQRLIDAGRCGATRSGAEVFVMGFDWGLVEIRPRGVTGTGWTTADEIEGLFGAGTKRGDVPPRRPAKPATAADVLVVFAIFGGLAALIWGVRAFGQLIDQRPGARK